MRRTTVHILITIGICLLSGCSSSSDSSSKSESSAHTAARVEVSNPKPEAELTTVKLSESSRNHLEIKTEPVRRESIPTYRVYPGQAVVAQGLATVIAAPLGGTINQSTANPWPIPGAQVSKGNVLFELIPSLQAQREVLSPADRISLARARADLESSRVQADGDVQAAQVKLDAARIALERAKKLVEQKAGSVRALDEAKAAYQLAEAELRAAESRVQVLTQTLDDLEGKTEGSPLPIRSPFDGVMQQLLVAPGEFVQAGKQLCEIIALNPLWIRVSVYVGDVEKLAANEPVLISTVSSEHSSPVSARPVPSPPTANPSTATVDRYYEIDNAARALLPGQRVKVEIPTTEEKDCLTIPRASILYDIHGDQWVYLESSPGNYVRRRISVLRIVKEQAIISSGLKQEDQIVTEGAAELFGIEFGAAGH